MNHPTPAQLTESIKSLAETSGFALCGIAPAISPDGFHRLVEWINNDFHGEMSYLPDRLDAYRHPESVMANVKSVVMLGMDYTTIDPGPTKKANGRIARYAWGKIDYHDLIRKRLRELESKVLEQAPELRLRTAVDTAPMLEREFAQLAGIGWFGKNTMLISRTRGSYFFLAAMLVDLQLIYDQPFETDHCGSCTACLDACPTNAFPEAGVLDATKCISYLTIEHRSAITKNLRAGIGDWLFGCDVCQEVCPWNRFAQTTDEPGLAAVDDQIDLHELFRMTDEQFRTRFRKTPMWRAKRRGMMRNAAIVLGNNPDSNSIETLAIGLADDESLIRGASAWAIGQIGGAVASQRLEERLQIEQDADVLLEINDALQSIRN